MAKSSDRLWYKTTDYHYLRTRRREKGKATYDTHNSISRSTFLSTAQRHSRPHDVEHHDIGALFGIV